MNSKKRKNIKNIAGFVMVEMLVAVSLILLVLPGTLAIASKALSISSYQKNQMIATYLAEEGQELVRSVRDKNVLTILRDGSGSWDAGFSSGKCTVTPCTIDIIGETMTAGSGNLDNLSIAPNATYRLYTDANGFYSHTASGNPTIFYRGIFVTPAVGHTDQVNIRSVVVWDTPSGRKKVEFPGFLAYWLQ